MRKIGEINDALLAQHFHWPSDGLQVWRHFCDYSLTDKKGRVVEDMLVEEGCYYAKGTLLARPGSNQQSVEDIEISFSTYAIDFGKSLDDAARGYWVKGLQKSGDDVWYKMEQSDVRYSKYSDLMEYKVDKFLALHDTLTKGKYKFVTTNPMNGLVSCKLKIKDFYNQTNKAFDYSFVEENCEFVLDHLKNNVDSVKSIIFLESIVKLGDIKKKDFVTLFPRLKSHYRKEEIESRRIENEKRIKEIEKKADFEEELSRDLIGKKRKEEEFLDQESSYIDQRKKPKITDDFKLSLLSQQKSSVAKKPFQDDCLRFYNNNGKKDSSILPQNSKKKKSYIDQIDDLTIFKIKEIPIVKVINFIKTQKLLWADDVSDGRLVERHIINYEEIYDINLTGKNISLITCLKKNNDE